MRPNFTFGPIDSMAQYLLYLSIVVLGILLPVLLQKWRTRREQQRLLERTLKSLTDEVAANRRRIEVSRKTFAALEAAMLRQREHYLALRARLAAGAAGDAAPQPPPDEELGVSLALTTRTAWDVARLANALVLLPAERLTAFTRAYQMQELYEKDRSIILEVGLSADLLELPADLARLDVIDARLVEISRARSAARYHVGLADGMVEAYDAALADGRPAGRTITTA